MSGPVGVEELAARLVDALVGVRAEEVALRLQQIRGQPRGAVAVVEGQRGGEGRRGNAELDGVDDGLAPGLAWYLLSALEKKSSSSRLSRSGFLSKAALMLPRKPLRMMQPPRHISAMPPMLRFQLYSFSAARSSM